MKDIIFPKWIQFFGRVKVTHIVCGWLSTRSKSASHHMKSELLWGFQWFISYYAYVAMDVGYDSLIKKIRNPLGRTDVICELLGRCQRWSIVSVMIYNGLHFPGKQWRCMRWCLRNGLKEVGIVNCSGMQSAPAPYQSGNDNAPRHRPWLPINIYVFH